MNEKGKASGEKERNRRGGPAVLAIVVIMLAVLAVISENYFSFLEMQLFEERNHF